MASKFVFFALLITFAFAHGRDIQMRNFNEVTSPKKEGRIIDIPLIGGAFILVCQVVGVLISKVWSLIEYKLVALSLVTKVVSWFSKHYIKVLLGGVTVLALCAVTGVFSFEPVIEVDLVRSARSLDHVVRYERLI